MHNPQIVEYKNMRVLTTQQLSESYKSNTDTITKNFNRNKDRYIEGEHYICLKGDELKEFRATGQIDLSPNIHTLYLWTQKGTLLHAKSLNTDVAWEVYGRLVDNYFSKQQAFDISQLSPELQMFKQIWDMQAKQELETKRIADEQNKLKVAVEGHEKAIQTVKDTFAKGESDQDVSAWVTHCINKIAESPNFTFSFGNRYAAAKNESYQRLTNKAGCRLDQKLRNAVDRAKEKGCTKAQIDGITKFTIIMADKRLKEIYISVIKEMMIAYCIDVKI